MSYPATDKPRTPFEKGFFFAIENEMQTEPTSAISETGWDETTPSLVVPMMCDYSQRVCVDLKAVHLNLWPHQYQAFWASPGQIGAV